MTQFKLKLKQKHLRERKADKRYQGGNLEVLLVILKQKS